jgi:hypothetical protein
MDLKHFLQIVIFSGQDLENSKFKNVLAGNIIQFMNAQLMHRAVILNIVAYIITQIKKSRYYVKKAGKVGSKSRNFVPF